MYGIKMVSHDVFIREIEPAAKIWASAEYGTRVEIILPSDQVVTVYSEPHYDKNPNVYISISEGDSK